MLIRRRALTAQGLSRGISRFLGERYLTLDRRVLGAFRIWFGLVLLADVTGRIAQSTFFYSNAGCLSNHFSLYAPMAQPYFSLYVAFSTPGQVKFALVATAIVFAAYTAGYRTRVSQVVSLVLYTSLNARNLLLENGGTVIAGIILAWTVWLPLGDRYSIDALLARLRRGGSASSAHGSSSFVSLAGLGLALQISAIYAFNVIQKTGDTWSTGQAVHLVLWQNRIATPMAAWLRVREPRWLSPVLTHATLLVEGSAPWLVLSPVYQRYTRTASFLSTTLLHAGIALLVSLGPFSYVMIALNLLLVPRETADWIERRLSGGRLSGVVTRAEQAAAGVWAELLGRAVPAERAPLDDPWSHHMIGRARETGIAVLMIAVAIQITNDNEAVPPGLRMHRPELLAAIIDYPRLTQGWAMFAPDAPATDGTVVIDGVTADGRHIDPFTLRPPDLDAPLHGPWYPGTLRCDYFGRIAFAPEYQGELGKYLLHWQEITGRPPSDRLVDVTAYWVSSEAPRLGTTTPRNTARRVLFREPPPP